MILGVRERKELMGGKCAMNLSMNLRRKLRCASRFPKRGVLS